MDAIPDGLDTAAATLTAAAAGLRRTPVEAAQGPGTPGLLGAALHRRCGELLHAWAAELTAAAARLSETGDAVRTARHAYAVTDDEAARRLRWEY